VRKAYLKDGRRASTFTTRVDGNNAQNAARVLEYARCNQRKAGLVSASLNIRGNGPLLQNVAKVCIWVGRTKIRKFLEPLMRFTRRRREGPIRVITK